jgi:hypothetical protein
VVAIRYLDPDEREKDKDVNTSRDNQNIGYSAYRRRCLGSTLASSKTTVMSCTIDDDEIRQWIKRLESFSLS